MPCLLTEKHVYCCCKILQIMPYRRSKYFMTVQIYLQKVMSPYMDTLGYQELFSWTFAIVWNQDCEAIHNDPTLFHHMCRFSRLWVFRQLEHFSRNWETGWACDSCTLLQGSGCEMSPFTMIMSFVPKVPLGDSLTPLDRCICAHHCWQHIYSECVHTVMN